MPMEPFKKVPADRLLSSPTVRPCTASQRFLQCKPHAGARGAGHVLRLPMWELDMGGVGAQRGPMEDAALACIRSRSPSCFYLHRTLAHKSSKRASRHLTPDGRIQTWRRSSREMGYRQLRDELVEKVSRRGRWLRGTRSVYLGALGKLGIRDAIVGLVDGGGRTVG